MKNQKNEESKINETAEETETCNCGKKCDCEKNQKQDTHYKDLYIRTLADLENFRKRTDSAIYDSRIDGIITAVSSILPSMDSFKQATSMISDKNVLKGVQFIERNILDSLTDLGVEKIDATGEFDPNYHNAISTTDEGDVPAGHIVSELSAGYKIGDRVIRYSQVIVKKEKENK